MDFGLSPEQEILKRTARDFFVEQAPPMLLREMKDQRPPYPADLWQRMAGLGWMGIALPGQYGGADGSLLDMMVLVEETGRACLPGPFFTSLLGGLAINALGTEKQKAELLPRIASGDTIAALALVEPGLSYDVESVSLSATRDSGGYALSGTKLFVPDVEASNYLICVGRTSNGITAFLVDVASASGKGLSYSRIETVSGDDLYEVVFDKVVVDEAAVLGEEGKAGKAIEKLVQIGAVAKSVDMVGASQRMLELSVEHAKERVQFGRPIGSFQAIHHHCANIVTELDTSRFLSYKAAWLLSEGEDCAKHVSMAKSLTSDAHRRVDILAHQVVAGVGLIIEHDLPMYTNRAMASELLFGTATAHREIAAQQLGL